MDQQGRPGDDLPAPGDSAEGPPRRIVQTDNQVIFFYRAGVDGGGGYGEYRMIPTDGRKHDPEKAIETTYMGYTVGHWEGDTLVVDSISFVDTTWLARGGFFHSVDMHVVEKFTRQGNHIRYEVTVEDPDVPVEPWVMTPRTLQLSPNPEAGLIPERGNCEVYEEGNIPPRSATSLEAIAFAEPCVPTSGNDTSYA